MHFTTTINKIFLYLHKTINASCLPYSQTKWWKPIFLFKCCGCCYKIPSTNEIIHIWNLESTNKTLTSLWMLQTGRQNVAVTNVVWMHYQLQPMDNKQPLWARRIISQKHSRLVHGLKSLKKNIHTKGRIVSYHILTTWNTWHISWYAYVLYYFCHYMFQWLHGSCESAPWNDVHWVR